MPFFLACGTSLVLWLVVAAAAFFGGMVAFLALGLDLGGGRARGADVSGSLGRGFSTNDKVNRKQLTQTDDTRQHRDTLSGAALPLENEVYAGLLKWLPYHRKQAYQLPVSGGRAPTGMPPSHPHSPDSQEKGPWVEMKCDVTSTRSHGCDVSTLGDVIPVSQSSIRSLAASLQFLGRPAICLASLTERQGCVVIRLGLWFKFTLCHETHLCPWASYYLQPIINK